MFDLLKLLWAAPEFRGRVVWAYTTLIIASTIGGLTPLVVGWTVDAAMSGRWVATLGMVGFNAVWGLAHWLRLRADTRGLEGSITAAAVRFSETSDRPAGEVLATINSLDGVIAVLRFTLPRAIETTCYAVVGIVGLAYLRWELAVLAVVQLLLASRLAAAFGKKVQVLGAQILEARDTLAEAVPRRAAAGVLWRCYSLTVSMSDREANASSLQLAMTDIVKYATIVLVAYHGGTAGQIMAALAFVRGIDNLADATIFLAGSSGKVKETVMRLN